MKSLKSFFAKAACMLAIASLSNSFTFTKAQAPLAYAATNESLGNIRFVQLEGDMLVFDIQLHDLPATGSLVRITDEKNNELYTQRINVKTYNVRYKIARENILKLNFEISGRKILLQQAFTVNFKTEERLEVTKL